MDLTYSNVDNVLQEAFTCYLAFLSHTQQIKDTRLPRRGKGLETNSDISTDQHYESRIAAAEACLRYTGRTARRVVRWAAHPRDSDDREITEEKRYPSLDFETFLPDADESPYLDPLSGNWILPITSSSAGPSGNGGDEGDYHNPTARSASQNKTVRIDDTSTPSTSEDGSSDDEAGGGSDNTPLSQTTSPSTTLYSLPQNQVADEAYARLLQSDEKTRVSHRRQVKKLASDWENEQKAQEAYVKKLERRERENKIRIEKDREVARKIEQDIQWERAALAREASMMRATRRAEERKRRDEAELRKERERQQRAKVERESRLAAEAEDRKRAERRRKEEEIARQLRERARKEAAAEKRRTKADCVSCMETGERKEMITLTCKHTYCRACITTAIKTAIKSNSSFKCCRVPIPTPLLKPHISPRLTRQYTTHLLLLSTKRPLFCSSRSCARFVPPTSIAGGIGTCPSSRCGARTCAKCRRGEHRGVCRDDGEGKVVRELAKKEGWRECPGCGQVVERTGGCLHITCRCKAEWCFSCGRSWGKCESTCGRD